ncbi:iron-containing alcohol dehydrogenase (plasmid) [Skermanella sp. TT6]|uniref:Iron-containing alcohol dehydrogenase n=1 Tax=Skermanella cutis TaxID=2775420 RepID=A0ABX7BGK6_9PROT|nr:iron-containing alcohol dehydrogenase [Skermanella sp. TT6]QQP93275.1 iron-containing alcohol dehydrogenase [Skermanella sp. TT6]
MASPTVFTAIQRLVHGRGVIAQLPAEIDRLHARKILIVTDPGLVKAGIAPRVTELLGGRRGDLFTEVEPDPSIETVIACAETVRREGYDLIIGLGGGSALDVAKCASVLARNEGDVAQYLGIDKVERPGVPKILIPTTSGTGSEVTNVAVLSLKADKTKKGIVSRHLLADTAILDPELTLGLPPAVTASTGMDALTHAIEAYVSRFAQPLTDDFALKAIRMIAASLRTAVYNGRNIEARESMLTASLYAGLAFGSAATGMVHGLAMPLGGQFNVPHGVANSVLLPYVMRWNMVSALDRYRDIAIAMGERVEHLPVRTGAERAVHAVEALSRDIGIPAFLDDLDIPRSAIESLASDGMTNSRQVLPNPRDVTYEGLVGILNDAFRKEA